MNGTSSFLKLDFNDVKLILKNTALVAASAGLIYLSDNIGKLDLGVYGPLLVPVVTGALNTAVRWLTDYSKK